MKKALYALPLTILLATGLGLSQPAHARDKYGDSFFEQTTQAVDRLDDQLKRRDRGNLPLLVTTAQNLDNIGQSDSVGRLVGELIASSLVSHGWAVQEVRLREDLMIDGDGEHLLSRDVQQLHNSYDANTAIVSTYSNSGNLVYITIKAVRLADGVVIASHSFVSPRPGRL